MHRIYIFSLLGSDCHTSAVLVAAAAIRACLAAGHTTPRPYCSGATLCGVEKQRHNYSEKNARNELRIVWRAAR